MFLMVTGYMSVIQVLVPSLNQVRAGSRNLSHAFTIPRGGVCWGRNALVQLHLGNCSKANRR